MKISHPKYLPEKQQVGLIVIDDQLMDDFCQNNDGVRVRIDYNKFDLHLQGYRPTGANSNSARMNEDTFTRLTIMCVFRGYEVFIEELGDDWTGLVF